MTDKILIDRAAVERVLDAWAGVCTANGWSGNNPYFVQLRAALDQPALAQQPASRAARFKLVPVEPDKAQIKEGNKVTWPMPCEQAYRAMVNAAPEAPERASRAGVRLNDGLDLGV